MSKRNTPPVVAELGRPETPEETASRKAATSRRYRESKTTLNLVIALVASLAVVLFLVLVVVRPDVPPREPVDYHAAALEVQGALGSEPIDPALPEGWTANSARLETSADSITSWYIGFITPDEQFIAVRQGVDANATWLSQHLHGARSTGERQIGGIEWTEYDHRDAPPAGNLAYAMSAVIDGDTVMLFGTANDSAFQTLALTIAAQFGTDG